MSFVESAFLFLSGPWHYFQYPFQRFQKPFYKKLKCRFKGFQPGKKQGVESAPERIKAHVAVDLVGGFSLKAALFKLRLSGRDYQGLQVEEDSYGPTLYASLCP